MDWRGSFYPETIEPGEMISVYARQLDTVEIDSTWYHMPTRIRGAIFQIMAREGRTGLSNHEIHDAAWPQPIKSHRKDAKAQRREP
jgi:hypothetical protein